MQPISEKARFLPNLKTKLSEPDNPPFYYLAFVQSPFLNEKVNNERTDFSIPRESARPEYAADAPVDGAPADFFADEISIRAIRAGALAAISEDLKPFTDEINTQKETALSHYVAEDGPQYRVFLNTRMISLMKFLRNQPTWK